MDNYTNVNGMIRKLHPHEPLPTNLLLLADDIFDKYISGCSVYVFISEERTLGVYALQILSPETVEIKNIAVHEHFQGIGIGKLLLQDAITRAKVEGFKEVLIGTGDVMFMQLYLYQKTGFEMVGIKENYYLQPGYPYPVLEKGLQLKHMVMLRMKLSHA